MNSLQQGGRVPPTFCPEAPQWSEKAGLTGTPIFGPNSNSPLSARNRGNSGPNSHTIIAKEKTYLSAWDKYGRSASQATRRRIRSFWAAEAYAEAKGWPLNTALTVSFESCIALRDGEGALLMSLFEGTRCQRFRRSLARLCKRLGHPFVAVWARAVSSHRGDHIHLLLWFPSEHWAALVEWVEGVTGVWASQGNLAEGGIAQGFRGCWCLKENLRGVLGAIHYAAYVGVQHEWRKHKPPVGGKGSGTTQAINARARSAAGFVWEAMHLPSTKRGGEM